MIQTEHDVREHPDVIDHVRCSRIVTPLEHWGQARDALDNCSGLRSTWCSSGTFQDDPAALTHSDSVFPVQQQVSVLRLVHHGPDDGDAVLCDKALADTTHLDQLVLSTQAQLRRQSSARCVLGGAERLVTVATTATNTHIIY